MELNDINNYDKIAIVVIGYNRLDGLKRLLQSINNAYYLSNDVPLIISIDCSGNKEVYDYVTNYDWKHGQKHVNIQKERLGLKNHILQCGDYSQYFRGVILLEDDLFVAPDFYNYTITAFDTYGNDNRIAGISLYAEESNGYVGLPYQPLHNGFDVYAWQTVSSWGEAWTSEMWKKFRTWFNGWQEDFEPLPIPSPIKNWTKAWSKYFYAYIHIHNLYFVYPYVSLSTNFNDAGGEHTSSMSASLVQVSLQLGSCNYRMPKFEDLVKYDVFQQNTNLYSALGLKKDDVCLDLYGKTFGEIPAKRYILSVKKLGYKIVKSYALALRPIELNVIYGIEGSGIYLYDTVSTVGNNDSLYPIEFISYCLKGFNIKILCRYAFIYYKNAILRKLYRS